MSQSMSQPRLKSKPKSKSKSPSSPKPLPKPSVPVFSHSPPVSVIGPHAFATLCNLKGNQLYVMSMSQLEAQSVELSSATLKADLNKPDLFSIPPEYRDEFKSLFTKKTAEKLPPHRIYDHAIPVQKGETPPFGTL